MMEVKDMNRIWIKERSMKWLPLVTKAGKLQKSKKAVDKLIRILYNNRTKRAMKPINKGLRRTQMFTKRHIATGQELREINVLPVTGMSALYRAWNQDTMEALIMWCRFSTASYYKGLPDASLGGFCVYRRRFMDVRQKNWGVIPILNAQKWVLFLVGNITARHIVCPFDRR